MPAEKLKVSKEQIKYNTGGEVSSVSDKSKAVKFLAINNELKLHYYMEEDVPLVGMRKIGKAIRFQNLYFETDDEIIIEALRSSPSFGGSKAKNYKDAIQGFEHLFFEGAYPEDVQKKMEQESKYITNVEGTYEQLKTPEERFTSIDRLN